MKQGSLNLWKKAMRLTLICSILSTFISPAQASANSDLSTTPSPGLIHQKLIYQEDKFSIHWQVNSDGQQSLLTIKDKIDRVFHSSQDSFQEASTKLTHLKGSKDLFLITVWLTGASSQSLLVFNLSKDPVPLVFEWTSAEEIYYQITSEKQIKITYRATKGSPTLDTKPQIDYKVWSPR